MADHTPIEWTDASWNPIVGCKILSPGCTHCYAMAQAARIERMAKGNTHYAGTTKQVKGKPVWTGKLSLAPENILTQPLRWKKPRKIFVNSMGDLFHEDVPDEWIDRVFAVIALSPQHTFQVLTKRADRMQDYLTRADDVIVGPMVRIIEAARTLRPEDLYCMADWPLPNVWLGVSAERQQEADERIPHLLATPAALRFVSAEPLLGPISFRWAKWQLSLSRSGTTDHLDGLRRLDWIIVGGESGPDARPMEPEWARQIRDHCAAAGVAFFFKQWGVWAPGEWSFDLDDRLRFEPDDACVPVKGLNRPGADDRMIWSEAERSPEGPGFLRVHKAEAGRRLDGVEYNAMPEKL